MSTVLLALVGFAVVCYAVLGCGASREGVDNTTTEPVPAVGDGAPGLAECGGEEAAGGTCGDTSWTGPAFGRVVGEWGAADDVFDKCAQYVDDAGNPVTTPDLSNNAPSATEKGWAKFRIAPGAISTAPCNWLKNTNQSYSCNGAAAHTPELAWGSDPPEKMRVVNGKVLEFCPHGCEAYETDYSGIQPKMYARCSSPW